MRIINRNVAFRATISTKSSRFYPSAQKLVVCNINMMPSILFQQISVFLQAIHHAIISALWREVAITGISSDVVEIRVVLEKDAKVVLTIEESEPLGEKWELDERLEVLSARVLEALKIQLYERVLTDENFTASGQCGGNDNGLFR